MDAAPQLTVGDDRRGWLVWFGVFGSIPAWALHIVALASLVQAACNDSAAGWTLHALTVVTAAVAAVATGAAWRVTRRAGGDREDAPDASGRLLFLGRMGLLIGAADLLLILLEGSYPLFIHHCV